MSLLERAKRFLARLEQHQPPTATDVVVQDHWDRATFDEVLADSPALRGTATRLLDAGWDTATDALGDLFAELWQSAPSVRPEKEMAPSHRPNHVVHRMLVDNEDFDQLRTMTVHDEFMSAVALQQLSPALARCVEEYGKAKEESEQQEDKREQAVAAAAESLAAAIAEAEQAPTPDDGSEACPEALGAALSAAQEAIDTAPNLEAFEDQARAAMNQAVRQAIQESAEVSDARSSWGLGPGQWERMSFNERAALAARMRRLKELTDIAGRMRRMAASQRVHKSEHGRDQVVGVALGGNPVDILPTEFAKASLHPALAARFARDLVNHQVLSRKYVGVEKEGRGPIVAVLDMSGSMRGERERWAKALGIALVDQARSEKRDCHVLLFSNSVRSFAFPASGFPFERLLDMAETFEGGGTDVAKALTAALALVNTDTSLKKADVIFVTDGDFPVSPAWAARYFETKEHLDVRTFGVAVKQRVPKSLADLCDNVRAIHDVTEVSNVSDIFATV